jgi:hypothetical protein
LLWTRAEPTLSARVHNKRAGRQTLTLVYLAHGISWQADYNVRLAPSGDRFDVEAWLTLANEGGTSFADAETAVVAGELNREDSGREIIARESVADHCWAWGRRGPGFWSTPALVQNLPLAVAALAESRGVEEIIVTARKREAVDVTEAQREELLDYHLYRIPWRTTVAAQQSKQVRFMTKRGVRAEWLYRFWSPDWFDTNNDEGPEAAAIVLRFENEKANQLGEPLPEGDVRVVQETSQGDLLLLGEGSVRNSAVGIPVEVEVGESPAVTNALRVTDYSEKTLILRSLLRGALMTRVTASLAHELKNARPLPVVVEVRQGGSPGGTRISSASHPWVKDRGIPTWRIEVPALESVTLSYRIRLVHGDD